MIILLFFDHSLASAIPFSTQCKDDISSEELIIERIKYVYRLKPLIAEQIWPGFYDAGFDIPLIYYSDTSSFVTNPTPRFIEIYQPKLVFQEAGLKVYKTADRLDDLPFHMAVSVTMGDSAAYDHRSPFIHASGLEETMAVIPDVTTTEEWATMILHEYFHGFQYRHEAYLDFLIAEVMSVGADSIQQFYRQHAWFKEKVDRENDILLRALETSSREEINELLASFFVLRKARREETKQKLGVNLRIIEKAYETMEGTARYVELMLSEAFSNKQPDYEMVKFDPAYRSYEEFSHYNIQNQKWSYQTSGTKYFYATGFNMARLLDKMGIAYKDRLFREGSVSLEDLLEEAL